MQGTAADTVKLATIEADRRLRTELVVPLEVGVSSGPDWASAK